MGHLDIQSAQVCTAYHQSESLSMVLIGEGLADRHYRITGILVLDGMYGVQVRVQLT